ncbi:hypothetical protein U1Q18_033181 [Sarracenia purpurea var. burkii]
MWKFGFYDVKRNFGILYSASPLLSHCMNWSPIADGLLLSSGLGVLANNCLLSWAISISILVDMGYMDYEFEVISEVISPIPSLLTWATWFASLLSWCLWGVISEVNEKDSDEYLELNNVGSYVAVLTYRYLSHPWFLFFGSYVAVLGPQFCCAAAPIFVNL